MDRAYDVFERYSDGSVRRRAAVVGLEAAIVRLEASVKLSTNEFFILSSDTQEIVHRADGLSYLGVITSDISLAVLSYYVTCQFGDPSFVVIINHSMGPGVPGMEEVALRS